MKIVFDRMAALDAHEGRKLVFAMPTFNVRGRESHTHSVGMLGSLLIHGINQRQSPMGVLALEFLGLNPDGEELSSQVSRLGLNKIEIALVSCRRIGQIEVFVKQALCGIGV